jgi:putative CocE/NonD family hydrolase
VVTQKRFLDYYLKGEDNGWNTTPRVRLEVRKAFYRDEVRHEARWPLAETSHAPLYLDATAGTLGASPVAAEAHVAYDVMRGHTTFSLRFDAPVEITGETKLRVWVSTSEGNDLDLFVALKKFYERGNEVFFSGFNGYRKDAVAKGWLRVSHRALDPSRNRPSRPFHSHDHLEKVATEEIVPVEIEILSSSTWFEAASRLELVILGRDAAAYPAFRHRQLVNRGRHMIHCGGRFDSHLLIPLVRGTTRFSAGSC